MHPLLWSPLSPTPPASPKLMKTYLVNQLEHFPTGTHIEAFAGEILRVGKYISGTGNNGEWSFQDLTVRDADGREITVTLDKKDELPASWRGAQVLFKSYHGPRGMSGVIVEDYSDRRNNNISRRIRITKTGDLEDITPARGQQRPQGGQQAAPNNGSSRNQGNQSQARQNAPQGQPQGRPQGQGQANPPQSPQNRQQGQSQAQAPQRPQGNQPMSAKEAVRAVKMYVAKLNTLRSICYDASVARAVQTEKIHGHKIPDNGIGAESTTLFIEVVKRLGPPVIDFLPLDYYKHFPYTGVTHTDLHPEKEALGELSAEELNAANLAAKAAVEALRKGQYEAPQERETRPNDPEWAETGAAGDDWKKPLEDDDIPF